jgi:hypothetical protein
VLVRTWGATVSADDDPIKAAVEQALREQITAWWQTPPRLDLAADYAVQAHRRAVLGRRDDGWRWKTLAELAEKATRGVLAAEGADLLAALADAEIARQQAEADRDVLVAPGAGTGTAAVLDGETNQRAPG